MVLDVVDLRTMAAQSAWFLAYIRDENVCDKLTNVIQPNLFGKGMSGSPQVQ